MGVGWGYGANMLTKYLAEVGERTPLTAATCIDNPFDLEEATGPSSRHDVFSQKLLEGLVDILQSSKELFRGRAKGFDVEKALEAKSVRDFEKAISMKSYGFDAIEDFYEKSSSRSMVRNVKIPVLFIQNDDRMAPLLSIPHSVIEENPFTSLLLCSYLPARTTVNERSIISWYQHLTIEWLAAVELGFLKGRHPLLKDVDVTINPSKGLALQENRQSHRSGRVNKFLNLSQSIVLNEQSAYPYKETLEESDISARNCRSAEIKDKGFQPESNGALMQASSVDAESAKVEVGSIDNESGQVLQAAQVVMNMLDVTMPGNLTEEQKKKVLTALDQGETFAKALQDAVPDNVREKVRNAVSEILHNQGTNLKLDRLLNINQIPNGALGLKSNIQEKVGLPSAGEYEDPHSSDQGTSVDVIVDNSNDNRLFEKDTSKLEKNDENVDMSRERTTQDSDYNENELNASEKHDFSSHSEGQSDTGDANVCQHKVDQDGELPKLDMKKEENIQQNKQKVANSTSDQIKMMQSSKTEEGHPLLSPESEQKEDNIQQNKQKVLNSSIDQNKMTQSTKTEEGLLNPVLSAESEPMEREISDNLKKEEKVMNSISNQDISDSSTFSMSQALDALTGIDDSTQVAVNSVFGVIEDMITHLEEEKDDQDEVDDKKEVEDRGNGSISEHHEDIDDSMTKEEKESELSSQSDMTNCLSSFEGNDLQNDTRNGLAEKKKHVGSPDPLKGNKIGSYEEIGIASHINKLGIGSREHLISTQSLAEHSSKIKYLHNIPLYISTNSYGDPLYKEYLHGYLHATTPNPKSAGLDQTTTLFLDYFPEEGQWKLLEQPENDENSASNVDNHVDKLTDNFSASKADTDTVKVIEPSYVIVDAEQQQEPICEFDKMDKTNQKDAIGHKTSEELMSFVKNIILDSLKIEVGRKISEANMKETESNFAKDMERVATVVSLAAVPSKNNMICLDGEDCNSGKLCTLNGEDILRAISSSIQETNYLRKVVPVGVVVGSSLAALRKFFHVASINDIDQRESLALDQKKFSMERKVAQIVETEADQVQNKCDRMYSVPESTKGEKPESKTLSKGTAMVGAVTAAVGASALLVHQQDSGKGGAVSGTLSKAFKEKGDDQEGKLDEETSEKNQNIVTNLAEKAMSIASPVVPVKGDGEVDQDRLVAMLSELGQKGGILKLFSRIALLWGGIRGAMSLTDRLISFLRVAERPLFQRVLAFVFMVLVLWSPVVVPLLPTLVQGWAMHNSSRIPELICIVGLYASVVTLVMLWGKRIRGFENPFEEYGLDLSSPSKVQNFLKGLIGGVMLVLLIQYSNVFLGCVSLTWPSNFTSHSSEIVEWLKMCGKMLLLVGQGIVTATGIAAVEELLFRSWLPDEIATDLGYYHAIIISGLAFSLCQRSPLAIPGLWLLSLSLAGARQRSQGSLSVPIGLRAGILTSSFVLQRGGFLIYQQNSPLWVSGTHAFEPFSGAAGLVFSLLMAIVLHPRLAIPSEEKIQGELKHENTSDIQ
ncbi:uncharacterized protein LOC127795879 isoform X2 [Diospyros lotus]|nr:uncharacterized protein LOC127795879 isoform X2 [Diospyros lotus]